MAVPFGATNILTPVNLRPFGEAAGSPPMTEQLPFGGKSAVSIVPPTLQSFGQDFVTFGGGAVPTLDAGWTYSGHNTASAYGTGENNSSRLRVFVSTAVGFQAIVAE